jgi:flagellar biosynthetic protein FliR
MGLGFAELVDPQSGVNVPTLSHFYSMIGTLVFLALNGHLLILRVVMDSFEAVPPGLAGVERSGLWALVGWGADMFAGAVKVALPAMAALFAVNLTTGVMTRAIPQFNLFIAFPLILLLGLLIVLLSLPALAAQTESLLTSAQLTILTGLLSGR